jgi:altronate dehydratase small subunit
MQGRAEAIVIDGKDNVAVALEGLPLGKTVTVEVSDRVERIRLVTEVPKGHKFALKDLAAGAAVIKYGQPIGYSTSPISRGEHVHSHNITSHPTGGHR